MRGSCLLEDQYCPPTNGPVSHFLGKWDKELGRHQWPPREAVVVLPLVSE
jgi:hypothetical protein